MESTHSRKPIHRFYFKLTALGGALFSGAGIVPKGPCWTFLSDQHQALPLPGPPSDKGAFPWLGRHQCLSCSLGQHNHGFMETEQGGAGPTKVPGTSTASAHQRGCNKHKNLSPRPWAAQFKMSHKLQHYYQSRRASNHMNSIPRDPKQTPFNILLLFWRLGRKNSSHPSRLIPSPRHRANQPLLFWQVTNFTPNELFHKHQHPCPCPCPRALLSINRLGREKGRVE